MLNVLQPFFRGDTAVFGESLQLADTTLLQPSVAHWFMDPRRLTQALALHAQFLGSAREIKAVASDWTLRYLTALLPPLVALSSLLRYQVRASWNDMALTLSERATPQFFTISSLGTEQPAADTATRYETLVWQHLAPLITLLHQHTRVPTKILRGNVHRTLASIFEQALQQLDSKSAFAHNLSNDRRLLLESTTWPDGRRNLLFLRQRQVPVFDQGRTSSLTLHANCCLAYQLPNTTHCLACPLSPEYQRRPTVHSQTSRPTT